MSDDSLNYFFFVPNEDFSDFAFSVYHVQCMHVGCLSKDYHVSSGDIIPGI